jgi:hypothetical protein
VQIDGGLETRDWSAAYVLGGKKVAIATVSRDRENLAAEAQLERATVSAA